MNATVVRNIGLEQTPVADWPELKQRWIDATQMPRADWELPVLVATAVAGEDIPVETAAALMAAVGSCQTSIILLDDILDNEPGGVYETLGIGKTANLALAVQALGARFISLIDAPAARQAVMQRILADMSLGTAWGQHLDVQEVAWDEESYWKIAKAKSTPFYGGVMALGAALVTDREDTINAFFQIGETVGEMVQIRDDLMDIMAQPAAPDWGHGGNLLMLYGRLAEDPREFETAVQRIVHNCDDKALETAQQILISDGAVDYCVYLLEERKEIALSVLERVKLKSHQPIQKILDELVTQVSVLLEEID